MARKNKKILESLEHWVERAATTDSIELTTDVHFDMLDDKVRDKPPGLLLVEASCNLLERVQTLARNYDLRGREWTLLIYVHLKPTKHTLPVWNKKYWKKFGKYIQPPEIVILRGPLGRNTAPEYYRRQINLPFKGFTNLTAEYTVHRNEEEIRDKEPYCQTITLFHRYYFGHAPDTSNINDSA